MQATIIEKLDKHITEFQFYQNFHVPHRPVIRNDKQTSKVRIVYDEVHYLTHRRLIRSDKQTSKARIVYDASSTIGNSLSLNYFFLPGLSLTKSLYGLLIRFRLHRHVFLKILIRHSCRLYWMGHIVILSDFYTSKI